MDSGMSYIYQGEKMPEMGRGNRQVTLKICLGKNNPYILNSKVYENFSLLYILDIIFFPGGLSKAFAILVLYEMCIIKQIIIYFLFSSTINKTLDSCKEFKGWLIDLYKHMRKNQNNAVLTYNLMRLIVSRFGITSVQNMLKK